MLRKTIVVAFALVAACNRSPTVEATNVSGAEVAAKLAAAGAPESFVRAGKWSTMVTIDSMTAPGMPPEAQSAMRKATSNIRAVESCVTPEQAKKPTPEMFNGQSDNCKFAHFKMGGGKIDMDMRCTGDGAGAHVSQKMLITGTYSPDRYAMAMTSTTDTGAPEMGPMTMTMHLDANRIGECNAKKAAG